MSIPVKAVLALALLWGVVSAVMWMAGSQKVTPDKVVAFAEANPLEEGASNREQVIRKLATKVNALGFEERRSMWESEGEPLRPFFESLKPDEFALWVELTAGPHFDAVMRAFNEMDPEERQRIAKETVERLKEDGQMRPDDSGAELDEAEMEEIFDKVASEGLRAYYQEADADTKIDLAPVMEELHRVMQNPKGRWKKRETSPYQS